MIWVLPQPSFWPEPKDPWAWQRALKAMSAATPLPDPRPCWEDVLRGKLSRRSVPGLYGLREIPAPPKVLGLGLLHNTDAGWELTSCADELLRLDRESYQRTLAELLVRRSAWVRLALIELASARWTMPRGAAPLSGQRKIRVNEDLVVPDEGLGQLPAAAVLMGDLFKPEVDALEARISSDALSALHSPLYLFHAVGWLNDSGVPTLPDVLASTLQIESQAAVLRRISVEEQDGAGFVPINKVAERFCATVMGGSKPRDLAAWTDTTFGKAIDSGAIEVHAWAPGQPRHGRGLYGDRERKLAKWTVHDDFGLQGTPAGNHREVNR